MKRLAQVAIVSGSRLRELRQEYGLLQSDLAVRLGVHSTTISNWERERWPLPEAAFVLIRAAVAGARRLDLGR